MTTTRQWDQMWLPRRPYATDDLLAGLYRMSRPAALGKRFIEANPAAVSNLLVVDIDHTDAVLRAVSTVGSHPMPNVIVENPRNGHAHAVWALAEPVTRTEYAHRAPLAYAAAVTEGLRRALDGDKAYSGLLTKNPTHTDWSGQLFTTHLRTLDQLAADLDTWMPPRDWRRTRARRADPIGLGRNCTLFESARHWAYRQIRHHFGDPAGLGAAIHTEATRLNTNFTEPLPPSEVHAIATSITRWITTRSRMWHDGPTTYEATFTTIQAARGRKGGEVRRMRGATVWENS